MSFDGELTNRVLVISSFVVIINIIFIVPCSGWHQTLTFARKLSYTTNESNSFVPSEMKFFTWHNSYAIYGARETLILLKPIINTSSIEIFSYNWSLDALTMEECRQEWNTKEKCYNDVIHVRILPYTTWMEVFCTYAHRPMVRSFDFNTMSFIDENTLIRDLYPPMDSERSYVMLNFNRSLVTAGYQGDYIPTIRATQGKTLLYALRQNSYFVGGFQYDGKAVFGVIETSDRIETNRVSRLVMACADRTEIVRKAILNCSTSEFEQSRSFVFHILTALIDPIYTNNGTVLLFTTFTTNNSSITASAVCLFMLDKQFYDVFTSSSTRQSRANEMDELIFNCSQSIPSTIDLDMVESERQFLPYLLNPLITETMSNHIFTAIDVIQYEPDFYCLIIGTSHGHLFTAFTDVTFKTNIFEELTLPTNMTFPINSITHKKADNQSYAVIITNHIGYLAVKLISCQKNPMKLCFQCWVKDCSIRQMPTIDSTDKPQCLYENVPRENVINNTNLRVAEFDNYTSSFDWSFNNRRSDEKSKSKLLIYIVIPLSFVVFILSILIIILLTKSNHKIKHGRFYPSRNRNMPESMSPNVFSHTYTNNVMYRTNNHKTDQPLAPETKTYPNMFPIKSEMCIRQVNSSSVYSTSSSRSLPSLIVSSPFVVSSAKAQHLSVRRLYKTYV